jgi:predicted transcriptional regulator
MEKQEIINISLPMDMIREIDRLAKEENVTVDKIMIKALNQYLQNHEVWQKIFRQGEEWAKELGIRSEEDIDDLIHEFRKEQSAC